MNGSREWVSISPTGSLRTGGAGLELNDRGEMKKPPFLTVPTFVPCCWHYSFLADQGEKLRTGLGTRSALFSAWSGSRNQIRTKRLYHLIFGSLHTSLHLLFCVVLPKIIDKRYINMYGISTLTNNYSYFTFN